MRGDDRERFTLTEDHIKLLRRAYVGWEDCEFGAPAIDCKRPYGNSDVINDIAEILNLPQPDWDADEDWPPAEKARMRRLHAETETALQIVLRTGRMEPGDYAAPKYTAKWERVA